MSSTIHILFARTDAEINRCFPVLVQLHPHLQSSSFLRQVRRQQQTEGYQLVYLQEDGLIKAVAGFRINEMLARGRFLYIDDLVTDASQRSKGYGKCLLDWLVGYAQSHDCSQVDLDCAVQRQDAQRFYLREPMRVSRYHFDFRLTQPARTP